MELTPLSLGKSVLSGALAYAKSAIAAEVALQLGIEKDHTFVADELDMMMSFMMEAHEERDSSKVVGTWVKQVRDTAYDVEDSLHEFAVHLERPAWWRFPCTLVARHRVAKQMKKLRAKVEEVSQRNVRYRLIKGSGSKAAAAEQSSSTAAAMFGIDDARRAAKQDNQRVDLVQLINEENEDLKVIAVWGTCGDIGQTSIIRVAYENPGIQNKFPVRAWARVMHPFSPKGFIQSLVNQFHATEGVEALLEADRSDQSLIQEFNGYVKENRFFIVLSDLSTIEEWDLIKKCFQNNKMGSRIVVSTAQVEVASLCAGQESQVSELKKLSADQTLYAFYNEGSENVKDLVKPVCSPDDEIKEVQSTDSDEIVEVEPTDAEGKKVVRRSLTRARTSVGALESQLIGREKQITEINEVILNKDSQQCRVISVWGMGGLGKTTLVGSVYESPEMSERFEKCAFVTITRPFNLEEFLRNLVWRLRQGPYNKEQLIANRVTSKDPIASMGIEELNEQLRTLLEKKSCLIVVDDISCTAEWNMVKSMFRWMEKTSRIIVTTREQNVAIHCSGQDGIVYNLHVLEPEDALYLFSEKVFGEARYLAQQKNYELVKEAEKILKKCGGLPLAIVVIGGFLANHPKDPEEWRRLNNNISAELEMNPEFGMIKTVLQKSFDGLPFDLKSCFLYLSIYPEDHVLSRRRLTRRWAAEGYLRPGKSAIEMADNYFMELINRSMILPFKKSADSRKSTDSCKVHDLLREIAITKSLEEDIVFTLEEGCSLKSAARHLAISSDWKGNQIQFESSVDLPRLRSLTVFGKFQSFFISKKMQMLRVLDLENAYGLGYHGLDRIGKLLHLTYLSLRGCEDIILLPDSLGKLRQLLTLDIRDTYITTLPKTIVKLQNLEYIHAGNKTHVEPDERSLLARGRFILLVGSMLCASCFVPTHMKIEGFNRCDACCMPVRTFIEDIVHNQGVWVPRGIRQIRGLLTLRAVKVGRGNTVFEDIRCLTGLLKLGVTGINKRNGLAFCLAIAELKKLESLSVSATSGKSGLRGCLDAISTPPENLQSLKLYGSLEILPEWVSMLQQLVKLRLSGSGLLDPDGATQIIGRLPKLQILSFYGLSFQCEEICFRSEQTEVSFRSIKLLSFEETKIKSVKFEAGTMPKLEQLKVMGEISNGFCISGLECLPGLNKVQLAARFPWDFGRFNDCYDSERLDMLIEDEEQREKCKTDELKKEIWGQLSLNENKPILIWKHGNLDRRDLRSVIWADRGSIVREVKASTGSMTVM